MNNIIDLKLIKKSNYDNQQLHLFIILAKTKLKKQKKKKKKNGKVQNRNVLERFQNP